MRTMAQKIVNNSTKQRNDPMKKYRVYFTEYGYQIVENVIGGCILESGKLWDDNLSERDIVESWIIDGKPCITDNEITYN